MSAAPEDFWFLDAALEMRINLDVLVNPRIAEALNRPGHGLTRAEVVAMLLDLQARGLIDGRDREGAVILTPESIEGAFVVPRLRPTHWYGLTAEGGASWERAALPRWDLFINEFSDGDREVIEAASVQVVGRYFERWVEFGAEAASRQDEPIAPWEPVYWKRLPSAHRISFLAPPPQSRRCGAPLWRGPEQPVWYSQPGSNAHASES
jgi:hypothetical protein